MNLSLLSQTVANGLALSMLYVLIASGITLMFGIMHIVNFAHGSIFMLSAFSFYVFSKLLGFNFFLSLLSAMAAIGIIGIIIGRTCFDPFRGELDRSFISSLGLTLIIEASMLVIFGNYEKAVRSPISGYANILGVFRISWERVIVIGVSSAAMTGLILFTKLAKLGQAMIAAAQDDVGAALQGIDLRRVSSLCMFIGCSLAAVAGVLVGMMFSIEPYMGGAYVVKCFMIVALGGLGSLPGAVLGGLILGFLEAFSSLFTGAAIGPLIAFIIVILILLFRPRGLLGHV